MDFSTTTIEALINEFLAQAKRASLDSEESISSMGLKDGKLLNMQQKNWRIEHIKNCYENAYSKLQDKLQEQEFELNGNIQQIEREISSLKAQIVDSTQGKHHYYRLVRESASTLEQLLKEEREALAQVNAKYAKQLAQLQEALRKDTREYLKEATTANTGSLITDLLLRYGKPEPAEGKARILGYVHQLEQRTHEALKRQIANTKQLLEEEIELVKVAFQNRSANIHDQVSNLKNQNEAWFNTIITVLIFVIEIPIHISFTTQALGIYEDGTVLAVFLKYSLAVGLPLAIGLIFKFIFFPESDRHTTGEQSEEMRKPINKYTAPAAAITVLVLIISIALLNGFVPTGVSSNQPRMLINITKGITFLTLTVALSFIGAYYFSRARESWKKQKVFRYQPAQNNKKQASIQDLQLRLQQQIQQRHQVRLELENLKMLLVGQRIKERFNEERDQTISIYALAFREGYLKEIRDRIHRRHPIAHLDN